jgi:hypothetical protein
MASGVSFECADFDKAELSPDCAATQGLAFLDRLSRNAGRALPVVIEDALAIM